MNQQSQHLDTHFRTSGTLVQLNEYVTSRHTLILKVNVRTLSCKGKEMYPIPAEIKFRDCSPVLVWN